MGTRIRALRVAKGMGQETLGKAAGISHNTIARIERGQNRPRIDTVEAIAKALGVPTRDLFDPAA